MPLSALVGMTFKIPHYLFIARSLSRVLLSKKPDLINEYMKKARKMTCLMKAVKTLLSVPGVYISIMN